MVTRLIETLGRQAAKKGEYKYFKTLIQRQRQSFFDKWQVRHTGEVFGRNLLRISELTLLELKSQQIYAWFVALIVYQNSPLLLTYCQIIFKAVYNSNRHPPRHKDTSS